MTHKLPDIKEARKRSVDNLQRLYTFIISLAVTESLRRLLNTFSDSNPTDYAQKTSNILMFVTLLLTVVPFYHGANRYLDATYVTGERSAKREAFAIDFLMLFIEGLLFFGLAVFTNNLVVFYSILGGLFIFDALWVWSTNITASTDADKFPTLYRWALVNISSAILSRLQKVLSQLNHFVSQKLPESTPAFFSRSRRLISRM